jgi:hypothetical protein
VKNGAARRSGGLFLLQIRPFQSLQSLEARKRRCTAGQIVRVEKEEN